MQHSDFARNEASPEGKGLSFQRMRTLLSCMALITLLSVLFASPAYSEHEDPEGPSAHASGNPQMNNCVNAGANLSNNYATNPCTLTANSENLDFAQNYYGGEQVRNHLEDWWTQNFLPALKSMTKQLSASLLDQTRQYGTLLDSQGINRSGGLQLQKERDGKKRLALGEQSCVSGTATPVLARSHSTSNVIANTMQKDINSISSGVKVDTAPSDPSSTTTTTTAPSSTTLTFISPAEDQKQRWETYCAEFHDPDNNNGVSICPEIDPEERYQTIPNGDIKVEDFLLNDTIDMNEIHHSKAAWAQLRNLVQPKIRERMPESAINSAAGREAILKQQHLDSALNIASNVISSIISRRAAVPSVAPETEPDPEAEPEKVELPDGSTGSGLDYAYTFAMSKMNPPVEGKFGVYYNQSTGNTLCQTLTKQALGGYIRPVTEAPTDGALGAWRTFERMGVGQTSYPPPKGAAVYFTSSSVYGHTGIYADGGKYIGVWNKGFVGKSDMSPGSKWGDRYLGYVIPLDNGQEMPLLPPVAPGPNIREIRIKAGIDPDDTSSSPSYNETMLAMTKERFMDPEYFIKMGQGGADAIKKEQAAISAYTAIQYQDIYRLQEQINALLAARASLKLGREKESSQISAAPVKTGE